jgi:DNA-directed RNA polymerase subunit D
MDIDILEQSDTSMRFVISGVNTGFVNTLRRTLLSEIPKMAIEDVDFHLGPISDEDKKEYESISPLFDETIAHRLGMIPIPTDLKLFDFRNKCKCNGEGCPSCTIMYSLKKMGPCTVYSKDLEPVSGDDKLKIRDENIPIVKLAKGQALLIYATAQLGTGKEHSKWSPTHGVGYKFYPSIMIDQKKCDKEGGCTKKVCPKNILKLDNKGAVVVEEIEKCTLCKACEEFCVDNKAIKVGWEKEKFIFQFETDGSLTAKETLKFALNHISEKFEELEKGFENMEE